MYAFFDCYPRSNYNKEYYKLLRLEFSHWWTIFKKKPRHRKTGIQPISDRSCSGYDRMITTGLNRSLGGLLERIGNRTVPRYSIIMGSTYWGVRIDGCSIAGITALMVALASDGESPHYTRSKAVFHYLIIICEVSQLETKRCASPTNALSGEERRGEERRGEERRVCSAGVPLAVSSPKKPKKVPLL